LNRAATRRRQGRIFFALLSISAIPVRRVTEGRLRPSFATTFIARKETVMKTNPAVWFEIYVQDMTRAQKCYGSVPEVKLEKLNTPDLQMLAFPRSMDMGPPGISGALVNMAGFPSGGNSTLVYFGSAPSVDDDPGTFLGE
jgi:predicted enzyme related to lactoylglutathione lyase